MAKKQKRVDSFFTRNVLPRGEKNNTQPEDQNQESLVDENLPSSSVNDNHGPPPSSTIDNPTFSYIEHDPGLRLPIWKYPVDKRDEIRRAYLRFGPHQLILPKYPPSGSKSHPRRFQAKWYSEFPWLEL